MSRDKNKSRDLNKQKTYPQDRRKILKFVQKLRKVKKGCR